MKYIKNMNKILEFNILLVLLLIFCNCKTREGTDLVPHIITNVNEDINIRCDYYENDDGTLIVYIPITSLFNDSIFISKYCRIITEANEKWDFSTLNLHLSPSSEINDTLICVMTEYTGKVFDYVKYRGRHPDGFMLQIK